MPSLKATLKSKKVTMLSFHPLWLQCNVCGQRWSPIIQEGGKLPRGFWKCPRQCNWQPKQYKHPPEVRAYFAMRSRMYRAKIKAQKQT
jgi:hypothetical protein